MKPPAGRLAAQASTRPVLGAALGPALLVALAAPAFFVLLQPWLGGVLLVAGIGCAAALERGRIAASTPSLTRDLSLIAVGLAIVSTMSLEATKTMEDGHWRRTLAIHLDGGAEQQILNVDGLERRLRVVGFERLQALELDAEPARGRQQPLE